MDSFFGIGIPELLIIFVLALIILGPEDMVKTARRLGRWVYRAYHSPAWRMLISTSQELRQLPTKLVKEAGLEETVQELRQTTAEYKAQLKQATNDVTAELQGATRDISTELKEVQQGITENMPASLTSGQSSTIAFNNANDPSTVVGSADFEKKSPIEYEDFSI